MRFPDRGATRAYPERRWPWIIENNWYFSSVYSEKPIMPNGLGSPELDPNPTRARTFTELSRDARIEMKLRRLPANCPGNAQKYSPCFGRACTPAPYGNLGFGVAATCSRFGQSGAVSSGMGLGMREVKRPEKLRIWRPEVVSRAGVLRAAAADFGCRGEGRFPGAQHFLRKRSLAEHPLDGRKRPTADLEIKRDTRKVSS